ncbi:uncharacterized protein LOC143580172 [Bidens hawaiensis]|uniref:uncharacterized protein LOC143580172 n=1 Tax=Bidens hawaiensis TaxID=980011 RepID=UPI00404B4245
MEVPNTSFVQNLVIDSSNPFYLHPSDYPGMILVSKFFDGNGYGAWKRAMSIALSAKNKLGVLYAETAQNLWNELNSRYGQASGVRVYQLQKNIYQISQVSSDIATYFAKKKSNWDELNVVNSIPSCTCGAVHAFSKREEDQRLIQCLVGLNPSYDMIRSNILMMQPIPSIDRSYGILIQDEKQREIHTTTTDFIVSSASMHANTG